MVRLPGARVQIDDSALTCYQDRMSTKVIVSLCVVIFATGCVSLKPTPRDEASVAKAEQELDKSLEKFKRSLLLMAAAGVDAKIAELKPQLDLTPEQEAAFRKAFMHQAGPMADEVGAGFRDLFGLFIGRKPVPVSAQELQHFQSDRDLLKPLLTAQQLAAYDAFKARQWKEQAAKLAEERLSRVDSQLGLNDEQRNELREIFAISEVQRLEAVDDHDFMSFPGHDNETKMLASVLTPAQFKRYTKLFTRPPQPQPQPWWKSFAGLPVIPIRR